MTKAKIKNTDILLVGSGCSALFFALKAPRNTQITLITKSDFESSDSFLAQGGICVLRDDSDYQSFFNDTLKAGHYENDEKSVDIMIRSSKQVIKDLISLGVPFEQDEFGQYIFTKEGCHSKKRILHHKDITGKAITETLLEHVKRLPNVKMHQNTTLLDIIEHGGSCLGGIIKSPKGEISIVNAQTTILATGGIGGLYKHSTNFKHLTGDAIAMAINHNIKLKDIGYVQVHPTTFYTKEPEDRSFLISESTRGEGAKLYGKSMERFANELLPRDLLTQEIRKRMEADNSDFVWEDLSKIGADKLGNHFPNIAAHCMKNGYDPLHQCIPVVPAQHYFMGGIATDCSGRTSMENLYAIGETACNGVHGRNRLASNSLLEALVFAERAALDIENAQLNPKKAAYATRAAAHSSQKILSTPSINSDSLNRIEFLEAVDLSPYADTNKLKIQYAKIIQNAIDESNGGVNTSGVPYRDFSAE